MTGRRSPFKRGKNHFILQERDKEILSVLYEYRFLTNDQLSALFNFGCLTRINSRLRKLYDNQFLCRHYLSHPSGQAKILHFLGPEGVGVISEKLGIDPAIVRKKRKKILKMRVYSLNRYVQINQFRLALVLALRKNPAAKLIYWKTQREIGLNLGKNFYPEAHFRCRYQNEVFNFFLEIDHPLRSRKQFQEKVQRYLKYGLEGYFERQFGFRFFRVLIVSPNHARLKNLLNVIKRQTDKMFWLTSWEMISPEKILSPIWFRPGKEELSSLLEVR